jgi:hypothetical protein
MNYANQRLEGCLEPLFHLVRRQNACILKIKNENHLHKILYRFSDIRLLLAPHTPYSSLLTPVS